MEFLSIKVVCLGLKAVKEIVAATGNKGTTPLKLIVFTVNITS